MTVPQYRTQFSLWAVAAAPLLLAMDLRTMADEIKSIVSNQEVIAVNQDPLGVQGHKVRDNGQQEVWVKRMADGSRVVVLLNRNAGDTVTISVSAHNLLGLPAASQYRVRHLWSHTSSTSGDTIRADVPPYGVAMMRIRPA